MIKTFTIRGIISVIFCITCFWSCIDEDFTDVSIKDEYRPSVAAPVGKAEFVLRDFLPEISKLINTEIYQDSSGLLYVMLKNKLQSFTINDIIEIENMSLPEFPTLSFSNLPFNFDTIRRVINIERDFGQPVGDDPYIDTIWLGSAKLNLNLRAVNLAPYQIIMTFENILKNERPLVVEYLVTRNDIVPRQIDLDDCVLTFTNPGRNNSIRTRIEVIIDKTTHSNPLSGSFNFSGSISNIRFTKVRGFVGKYAKTTSEINIPIDVFSVIPKSDAEFIDNPIVKLLIDNNLSVPVSFYFKNATFSSSSKTIVLAGSGVPYSSITSLDIAYPALSSSATPRTTILFSKANSNIDKAFQIFPNNVNLQTIFLINKNGFTRANRIRNTDSINLSMELKLPVSAKVRSFPITDTLPFNLGNETEEIKKIQEITILLNITNRFPTDAFVQVYLADEAFAVKDSILNSGKGKVVSSAEINSEGKVIAARNERIEIIIPKEKINKVSENKYLIIKSNIQTSRAGEKFVNFYADYSFTVMLSLKVDLSLNLSDYY